MPTSPLKNRSTCPLKPMSVLAGLFSSLLLVSDLSASEPHKTLLENGNHTAEVRVDRNNVTVTVKRDSQEVPHSILVTFFNADHKSTTLELKSLSQPASEGNGTSTYTGAFLDHPTPGQGSATLSPSQQSFMGIEVRIPLTKDKSEIFRSKQVN